jgi:hypothetical protein
MRRAAVNVLDDIDKPSINKQFIHTSKKYNTKVHAIYLPRSKNLNDNENNSHIQDAYFAQENVK